jgi:hypothetical protein
VGQNISAIFPPIEPFLPVPNCPLVEITAYTINPFVVIQFHLVFAIPWSVRHVTQILHNHSSVIHFSPITNVAIASMQAIPLISFALVQLKGPFLLSRQTIAVTPHFVLPTVYAEDRPVNKGL